MGLIRRRKSTEIARSSEPSLSLDGYLELIQNLSYGGISYSVPGPGLQYTSPGSKQEPIGGSFRSFSQLAFKSNPVVFACMNARAMLFSEARFQYRRFDHGRPGDLFGDISLAPVEKPWPGATTRDLLKRTIQYADLAGNAFIVLRGSPPRLAFLRPDWVAILVGVPDDEEADAWSVDAEILGYVFVPGGQAGNKDRAEFFLPEEVAHFAPIPDPEARFRGMSWLTPLIRDIMADKAQTDHKLTYLENGATPNLIVKLDVPDLEAFEKWTDKFRQQHEGARNAGKTLFLAAGADATVAGANLQEVDFAKVQASGENRIASAAGVPPILVGLTDGLKASTYSNYQQARRHFADNTMRPLWGDIAGSLENILKVPNNANLWYDARDISALQDDRKDAATIQQTEATTIASLLQAGFKADSVIAALLASDWNLLEHSELFSVQLQPAGSQLNPGTNGNGPPSNGNGSAQNAAGSGKGA